MALACVHLGESPGAAEAPGGLPARLAALVGLAVVAALMLGELGALRGDLAFRRFLHLGVLTPEIRDTGALRAAVRNGAAEGDLVMELARRDPEALWTVSAVCLRWAGRPELEPLLRLNTADMSVGAAALAVRASPSNYENWLQLARALRGVGLGQQARSCLARARAFAPRGLQVEL
jgi:hypothetical protein